MSPELPTATPRGRGRCPGAGVNPRFGHEPIRAVIHTTLHAPATERRPEHRSLCVSLALLSQGATSAAVEPRRFSFSGVNTGVKTFSPAASHSQVSHAQVSHAWPVPSTRRATSGEQPQVSNLRRATSRATSGEQAHAGARGALELPCGGGGRQEEGVVLILVMLPLLILVQDRLDRRAEPWVLY